MSTIFAKIISGEVPADIVYQDDRVTAFRDINPAAPVHVLIVPGRIIATINDLSETDEALVGHMVTVAKKIATDEGVAESGYRLIWTPGKRCLICTCIYSGAKRWGHCWRKNVTSEHGLVTSD